MPNAKSLMMPDRRHFLAGAGSFTAWAFAPSFARAATADPRFVVVVLRGALDGMSAVPPIGDQDYTSLRGDLAINAALPLNGFFGLHPAMPKMQALYQAKQLIVVHAAASPYRDRSHFDGQDVLESGFTAPRAGTTGWLNRAAAALPAGGSVSRQGGLATMPTVPLILRGSAPVLTWIPPDLAQATPDTVARLLDMYQHTDPEMARIFAAGRDVDMMTASGGSAGGGVDKGLVGAFEQLTTGAGLLLAQSNGPRVAAISFDGWDTHARQGGRLIAQLAALDGAMDALRTSLGPAWSQTTVLVITEFGRTARKNGTEGTDHGTATAAFVLGGAVKGGRVIADWPGLKDANLRDGRDLAATTDLRAIAKGLLRDQLGLSDAVLASTIFPDSAQVRPLGGLV